MLHAPWALTAFGDMDAVWRRRRLRLRGNGHGSGVTLDSYDDLNNVDGPLDLETADEPVKDVSSDAGEETWGEDDDQARLRCDEDETGEICQRPSDFRVC